MTQKLQNYIKCRNLSKETPRQTFPGLLLKVSPFALHCLKKLFPVSARHGKRNIQIIELCTLYLSLPCTLSFKIGQQLSSAKSKENKYFNSKCCCTYFLTTEIAPIENCAKSKVSSK